MKEKVYLECQWGMGKARRERHDWRKSKRGNKWFCNSGHFFIYNSSVNEEWPDLVERREKTQWGIGEKWGTQIVGIVWKRRSKGTGS